MTTDAPLRESAGRIAAEASRRRTFAIISHPDAGKTTLTEKLLLYSGAVDLAGSVRARKNARHATSDWLEIEKTRGISVSATVLQFEHEGRVFNLLDTPGHQDFSEDTYRTLIAADSAVMVLDAAKGIEPQTLKLFKVCRRRGLPMLTFINKLDHPGRDPLALLDEIESVLGITAVPLNWPIGQDVEFKGVYDLRRRRVLRFDPSASRARRSAWEESRLEDATLATAVGERHASRLRDEIHLLSGAGARFDRAAMAAGEQTPVFFGSALNNFGVAEFLAALGELAPPPGPRHAGAIEVRPESETFSGFVLKLQANMDPRHRDCIAFLRVCSGRLERDALVHHVRLDRRIRLARPQRLFAHKRETLEEAFPGDVVGLQSPGAFRIGDTVCAGEPAAFEHIPRFAPEHFAVFRCRSVERNKQFDRGMAQLAEEGAILLLRRAACHGREPIVAVAGELQFDVARSRLLAEYGVEAQVQPLGFSAGRWTRESPEMHEAIEAIGRVWLTYDTHERPFLLFESEWDLEHMRRTHPGVVLDDQA